MTTSSSSISLPQALLLQGLLLSSEGGDLLYHADLARRALYAANAAEPYIHGNYTAAETDLKSRLRRITGSKVLTDRIYDGVLASGDSVRYVVECLVRYHR